MRQEKRLRKFRLRTLLPVATTLNDPVFGRTRPRGFSCECSQTPRFLYTRNAEQILGGPGNVRFVKLSASIILACAIPASAHSPRVSGQAVGRGGSPASRQTQQLPKSCLAQQHPSEQINALLETIRDHPTAGAYKTTGALFSPAPPPTSPTPP